MKKYFLPLLILLAFSIQYSQQKNPTIYNYNTILEKIKDGHLEQLNTYINPINLYYIDSSSSRIIINLETDSKLIHRFEIGNKDCENNIAYYVVEKPEKTIQLAELFNDKRAIDRLFEYYKKLPKFIESDTTYNIYGNIDEILAILLRYEPAGLREKLIVDFIEWEELASKSAQTNYIDTSMIQSETEYLIKNRKQKPDCDFIALQIACALNYLGEPTFGSELITKLRKKQKDSNVDYKFPLVKNTNNYIHSIMRHKIQLKRTYKSIFELIKDWKYFKKIIIEHTDSNNDQEISLIIYKNPSIAYLESSEECYESGFRFQLIENELILEKLWEMEIFPAY